MVILPVQGAQHAVKQFPNKLNIISVERNVPSDIKDGAKNHLQLDIDDLDYNNLKHQTLGEKYKFAAKEDILKAIEFAQKYKVHIIHCGAGISRSPAIAYAIFRSQGLDKSGAMSKVMDLSPHADPNKWIIHLTDELFDGD